MSSSEYFDAYCVGGKTGWKGPSGGAGSKAAQQNTGSGYQPCDKAYEIQPVGGKAAAKARGEVVADQFGRLPAQDSDFVATVYDEAERGTHRVKQVWQDPRWSDAVRADTSTLYNPADRDPPNRNNFYVYRSTLVDSASTPCKPLAVPDVHKLRYMMNNYMSYDDWY